VQLFVVDLLLLPADVLLDIVLRNALALVFDARYVDV